MGFHGKQILPGTLPVDRIYTTGYIPTAASDLTTVAYVQALNAGLDPKNQARVRAVGNINLASPPANLDSVVMNEGDRVVLGDQTDPVENGVYDYHAAGMTRSADCDGTPVTGVVKTGTFIFVAEGTTYSGHGFFVSGTPASPPIISVDTDPIIFSTLQVQSGYVAGSGLTLTGNSFALGGNLAADTTIDGGGLVNMVITNLTNYEVASAGYRQVLDKGGSIFRIENYAATQKYLDIQADWRINIPMDAGGGAGQVNADYSVNFGANGVVNDEHSFNVAKDTIIDVGATSAFAAGLNHVIGNGVGPRGRNGTAFGVDTINNGEAGMTSGVGAEILYVANQRGGIAHGLSTGTGLKPVGVPYVTASAGAINISRNTVSQTSGFGALAQDSVILGGYDHHIPVDSPGSVILGGSTIQARATDPNQVYLPNLNIMEEPLNGGPLDSILVRDSTTGQIKEIDQSAVSATLNDGSGTTFASSSVNLGGLITMTTDIDLDNYEFKWSSTAAGYMLWELSDTANNQNTISSIAPDTFRFEQRDTNSDTQISIVNGSATSALATTWIRAENQTAGIFAEIRVNSGSANAIIITDSVNNRGAEYAADYSANYTNRSLVDKEYVDSVAGSTYTFTNGITESAGTVKLGGDITENTNIEGDGYSLVFGENTKFVEFGAYADEGIYFNVNNGDDETGISLGNSVSITSNNQNTLEQVSFNIGTGVGAIKLFDNRSAPTGIEYNADYSANYTNRSLVDKEYVDNAVGSASVTASNGLTKVVDDIQLGGALIADTTITGAFALNLNQTILRFGGVSSTSNDHITDYTVISSTDGTISKRRMPWVSNNNRSTTIQPIKGPGTITVTNGSNAVTGTGTNFTDATFTGMSFWVQLWVYDGTNWWRGATVSVSNATNLTASLWYSFSDATGGYFTNSGTTFPGVSGTYEYYIVNNFSDNFGVVFGNQSVANNYSFAFGGGVSATGVNSIALGNTVVASGTRSMAVGSQIVSSGNNSFAGGIGTISGGVDRRLRASGNRAFNWSENTTAQTAGNGALGANGAILGGTNHHIPSTSARVVILGGSGISARASDNDQVYVPNFNIMTAPANDDTLTQFLVRDNSTGQIKYRDAASFVIPAPSSTDMDLSPAIVTIDNGSTTLAITNTPTGLIVVALNGVIQSLGDGVKTKNFYFSGDGGTTARAYNAIVATDVLYFNAVIAGFNLATTDTIDMIYI